jgi:hypothetical protein
MLPIDRNRPRSMAEAIMKPSAIVLAGAGASAAILGGIPLIGAAVVGAACWAARVALAMPRTKRGPRIDTHSVPLPWRSFVKAALDAQRRFADTIRATLPGPLHDKLSEIEARIEQGVRECYEVAQHGARLDAAVKSLRTEMIEADLEHVESQLRDRGSARPDLEATATSLRQQLASATRLAKVARDTYDRLTRLSAELNEAVARAVELSLNVRDAGDLDPLGSDVDAVVSDLEAFRQGLDAAERATGEGTSAA